MQATDSLVCGLCHLDPKPILVRKASDPPEYTSREVTTYLRVHGQVVSHPDSAGAIRSGGVGISGWDHGLRSNFRHELDRRDLLKQPY